MLAKVSTAVNVLIFMADANDQIMGKTGLTLTVTSSKAGAALASISPTVTERTLGYYQLALTSGMVDTLGQLQLNITATGAITTTFLVEVLTNLPGDVAIGGGGGGGFVPRR